MNAWIKAVTVALIGMMLFLLAGVLMTACTPSETSQEGDGAAKYTFAVLPKGLKHQFWLSVKAGADSAADEFGVDIIWKGPPQETDVAAQISLVEDMISRRVDAIVLAACDQDALVSVTERAAAEGIPVVTIDSGVKSDRPVTFVATDNVAGAKAAADVLAELVGEAGKVGLIPFVPGAATSQLREQGFREGIAAYPGIELASVLYSYSDVGKAMAAAEDMMTAHSDLAGIFAANESGAVGAIQALEVSGRVGKVKLVAFDASDRQIEALKSGAVQALVVQNPFEMGYQGVKAAVDHIEGREPSKRIDTGVTVVTADNLNEPAVQKLLHPGAKE